MPPENSGDRAPRPDRSDPPPESGHADDIDFGSYVSSTVRSSAELFGTPAKAAPARRQPPPPAESPESTSHPASPEGSAGLRSRQRSERYWRDSVEPDEEAESAADGDGDGGHHRFARRPPGDDGNRPTYAMLLIGGAVAVVLLILVIWYISGRGDDGGEKSSTPTATTESVIDTSATMPPREATRPAVTPTEEPELNVPTPTATPRRGGDNQRNKTETPAATEEIIGGP